MHHGVRRHVGDGEWEPVRPAGELRHAAVQLQRAVQHLEAFNALVTERLGSTAALDPREQLDRLYQVESLRRFAVELDAAADVWARRWRTLKPVAEP